MGAFNRLTWAAKDGMLRPISGHSGTIPGFPTLLAIGRHLQAMMSYLLRMETRL